MFKIMMRGVLAALAVSILAPAGAQAGGCPAQTVAQRFLPWADPAWYAALPGGGFEPSTPAWTLTGGAATVDGNEPFHIGSPSDARSLRLPAGATGTSPYQCIAADHPTLRLIVRNGGSAAAQLTVSAVVRDASGRSATLPIATIATLATDTWGPSAPIPVALNVLGLVAPQSVAFRFDAVGAEWSIDDVYVDPYGKG
jgi:hypothetical protein